MTLDHSVRPVRDATTPTTANPTPGGHQRLRGWMHAIAVRRDAARRRRLDAQLAELAGLERLLGDARDVLDAGWIQHAWFAYVDERGRTRKASSAAAIDVAGRPLVGACLVGAVVYAAGGPHAVHSQPVQRALDLVWHALASHEGAPVLWCPAPDVRMGRVRDLTSWNDAPARTASEVTALLLTAERVAVNEGDRLVARAAARAHA